MTESNGKTRRGRGDHGISWDKINKCYVGTISLGHDGSGKRTRRTVRGKTKAEVKDKLAKLADEINAGINTPATYTVGQCVREWLDGLDPGTLASYRGQAEKWIYPKIGATKLKDFTVADAERFFKELGNVLSKRSLLMIKSTMRRSIRRAQKHDLIGRNVAELADLPEGQPGRPSRAMTQDQAGKLLEAASGNPSGYVKVVKVGKYGRAARRDADRRTGLCSEAPPGHNGHRGQHRPGGHDLHGVPWPARAERHPRRVPPVGGAVRALDHARPSPRRATGVGLGSRQPSG